MSGGFHVSTEELHTHAATVGGIADGVSEAADAAKTERAGGLVYGVLFDVLALTPLNMWADHIHDLIDGNVRVGRAIAAGIKTNAETYDGVEQANKTHIVNSGKTPGGEHG